MFSDNPWWWFSFFDKQSPPEERFIGVALVQARDFEIAKMALERFGIYPGGEAVCAQIPVELGAPPEPYRERLLNRDEARALADLMEARRPKPKAANRNADSPRLDLDTGGSAKV